MHSANILAIILVAIVAALANAQCVNRTQSPVDPSVIGKRMRTPGCRRGNSNVISELRIHSWGIFWQPTFAFHVGKEGKGVCPEEIVALFRRSDKPAMLYHRSLTPAAFFQKSHPKIYAGWAAGTAPDFPCHLVKAVPVPVWGPKRALFKRLVGKMVKQIRADRGRSCTELDMTEQRPMDSITVRNVKEILSRHEIANNAIASLHNLAYASFFCV